MDAQLFEASEGFELVKSTVDPTHLDLNFKDDTGAVVATVIRIKRDGEGLYVFDRPGVNTPQIRTDSNSKFLEQ